MRIERTHKKDEVNDEELSGDGGSDGTTGDIMSINGTAICFHRNKDATHVQIKSETEYNISVKAEPLDDDLEGTAQALCVTEMRIDEGPGITTEEHCIVKLEPVEHNKREERKVERLTDAGDKLCSEKKGKPRRIRRETSEKRHECKICHKYLSGISSLKAHYRTHTGEKPYACNVCNNRFNQKAHLDMHLRTHTGGKPYECYICKTRFTQKINLQRHFRSHNGEKPYECKVCQNRFTRKSALLRHSSLHMV